MSNISASSKEGRTSSASHCWYGTKTTQWHYTSPDQGTAYVATGYNGSCSQAVKRGVNAEDADFIVFQTSEKAEATYSRVGYDTRRRVFKTMLVASSESRTASGEYGNLPARDLQRGRPAVKSEVYCWLALCYKWRT